MNLKSNDFKGENNKIIEIVSSDSTYGLIKRLNNNVRICLPLSLSVGKLDGLKEYNRNELLKYDKSFSENDFTKIINKLNNYVKNAEKIRVWSSHLDSNDYCLLLFICKLYSDKNISVIYSDEFSFYATTMSMLSVEDLNNFECKEHILKDYEIEEYIREYNRIVDEDTELRYMLNGQVISCSIEYFDEEIIKRAKSIEDITINKLIGSLLGNPIIPNVKFSAWFYKYLINRLIENHSIENIN